MAATKWFYTINTWPLSVDVEVLLDDGLPPMPRIGIRTAVPVADKPTSITWQGLGP